MPFIVYDVLVIKHDFPLCHYSVTLRSCNEEPTSNMPHTRCLITAKNISLLWKLQEVMIVVVESDIKLILIVTAVSKYE